MDRRRYLAALGAAATLAGCGGRSGGGGTTGDGGDTDAAGGDADAGGSSADGSSDGGVAVETVATDLEVPWGVAVREGSVYVTERPGRIVRLADGGVETVVESIPDLAPVGEGGLLGLAFHPSEPYAYTHQTYETAEDETANRLVRHDLDAGWTAETLAEGIPGARIHDGGRLLVHDGALYMTCGDAAVAERAQDRSVRAGSVLRFTLDGDPHPDNPFDSAVFSYGHRNPQGLAVRDETLYSTEHGPQVGDEINVLTAGNNYGWPAATGPSDDPRFTDPVTSYSPTIAPASATFYDGPISAWQGDFFFGTLKAQHVHRVRVEDGAVAEEERLFEGAYGRIRTVFTGPDGHLHATTSNRDGRGRPVGADDRVLRFVPE
jgi:glucose/arabinose dehydrogenase